MTAEHMCDRFRFAVDKVLLNWVAPDRFKLYNVRNEVEKYKHKLTGITL